jgi:hypothetical protein
MFCVGNNVSPLMAGSIPMEGESFSMIDELL